MASCFSVNVFIISVNLFIIVISCWATPLIFTGMEKNILQRQLLPDADDVWSDFDDTAR